MADVRAIRKTTDEGGIPADTIMPFVGKEPPPGWEWSEIPVSAGYGLPPKQERRLYGTEFRALMDWFMMADPWPLDDDHQAVVLRLLDEESHVRGYGSWVEAYHLFDPMTMETPPGARPEIVVLCGSTRFRDAFIDAQARLTLNGAIVLSVGMFGRDPTDSGKGKTTNTPLTTEQKSMLDELHKRKIDLADRVLVLNVDGYIGESTKSEVRYAVEHSVPVDWLEPDNIPEWR